MRHISLRQLEFFQAVAENLSMSRAAETLCVTQPAVSRTIHDLEDELGQPLVSIKGRSLSLTERGQILAQECHKLFRQYDDLLLTMQDNDAMSGALSVSLLSLLQMSLLNLHGFLQEHPKVNFRPAIHYPEDQMRMILHSQVELGVSTSLTNNPKLKRALLCKSPVYLYVAADHPLAQKKDLCLADLKDQRFVASTYDHQIYSLTKQAMTEIGANEGQVTLVGNGALMQLSVADGFGVALMPDYVEEQMSQKRPLKRILTDQLCYELETYLIWQTEVPLSQTAKAFRTHLLGE